MKEIRIAIVGAGGMGRVHYANFQQIKDCKLVAVVGSSQNAKSTAEEWKLPCFDSIAQMTQECEVDVIDICTPTYTHKEKVLESIEAGKHVICEKPIALSAADATEMLEATKNRGVQLYIAQVLQFTKEVEILRETVRSGRLGKPLDAYFERLSACPKWAKGGWLFDAAKSGLLPYDLHIHDLDLIVSIFGKPDGFSFTSCSGDGKTYPEQFRVSYDYGRLHVSAEAAWFNADIPWTADWRVYFENGMLINDGKKLIEYLPGAEPIVHDTTDEVTVSTGINVPPCGWYYNELKHFLDCIRENKASPYVTGEQLITVMEILEEISVKWKS